MYYKKKILNKSQLKKLGEHKYNCVNYSLLDVFLQPYWNFLVGRMPLTIAPNLITIIGLFVNIITSVILQCYSPDAKSQAPSIAYLLCGVGLFVYQSLDAIDGKQARRTNTSSPLGELFDHGCDSISTFFVAIAACCAVQLGNHPNWMFLHFATAVTLFYVAHWQTYITGALVFGKFDVTEAQYTIMSIHFLSALFGPTIWSKSILGIELWMWLSVFSTATALWVIVNFASVFRRGGVGKNGSTVAGTSIISPILPFLLVLIPAYVILKKSRSNLFEHHPVLYMMTFGMLTAKVTNRLVVAHMSKSEMNIFDFGLIGPLLLFLNQYFNEFITEYYVLWIAFLWCTVDLGLYSGNVCLEICEYLNIKLFKIDPKINNNKSTTVRK